jgi:hypothetical protein
MFGDVSTNLLFRKVCRAVSITCFMFPMVILVLPGMGVAQTSQPDRPAYWPPADQDLTPRYKSAFEAGVTKFFAQYHPSWGSALVVGSSNSIRAEDFQLFVDHHGPPQGWLMIQGRFTYRASDGHEEPSWAYMAILDGRAAGIDVENSGTLRPLESLQAPREDLGYCLSKIKVNLKLNQQARPIYEGGMYHPKNYEYTYTNSYESTTYKNVCGFALSLRRSILDSTRLNPGQSIEIKSLGDFKIFRK